MSQEINQNRSLFPRGLRQPEQGFRFSIDSLLLSCFAQPKHGDTVMDLGCGCGVVGFALLLANPDSRLSVLGIDVCSSMTDFACQNSALLGFSQCFTAHCASLAEVRSTAKLKPESVDLVVCNPPYRDPNRGRISQNENKKLAKFTRPDTLSEFVQTAAYLLKNKKKAAFITTTGKLLEITSQLQQNNLTVSRLMFIHSRQEEEAKLVLTEAIKNGRQELKTEPPLILYKNPEEFTANTLKFCPFLKCNSQRTQPVT